jgi:hypothetical protein
VQESHVPETGTPLKSRPARVWIGRIGGVVFGIVFAWLLVEVLLRLFFFSLPPRLQLVLSHVHTTPFSDSRLMPDPIWQPDIDFLTIARPVQNYEQYGSADVHFTVTTESLWGMRGAFRTRRELVDRYVDGVALGDSFTFCFTDESDCWVQRLSQLTERNIINFGVVSTGSIGHQRVMEGFGMPLKPPLVLWKRIGNDANEDYGLAALRGETTIQSANPAPPVPQYNWWGNNSAVYMLLKLILGDEEQFDASLQFLDRAQATEGDINLAFGRPYLWGAFDMSQPTNQYGWERSQQAIRDTRAMVQQYGGSLVIILMPTKEQVYRELSEPLIGAEKLALLDENYDLMLNFCASENLTCIDLLPIFQPYADEGEQLYFTTDMHLNPRGNEVLAEALAGWLDDHPEVFEAE